MPITPPLLCITLHQRSHLNKMTIGNGFVTISENKGSWVCPICSWHWAQTGTLLALHLTAPSSALHIYTMHHHTTMTEASEWLEIFFLRFTAITAISLCKTNSIQSIINCGNCWSGTWWKKEDTSQEVDISTINTPNGANKSMGIRYFEKTSSRMELLIWLNCFVLALKYCCIPASQRHELVVTTTNFVRWNRLWTT